MKIVRLVLGVLVSGFAALPLLSFAENIEVVLIDNLDGNLNGYCLDIMGGGQNIDPSRGLQAHTCYSYRGDLGPDQGIDPEGIAHGEIRLPSFEVCAVMSGIEQGAGVALSTCDDGELQQFDFSENGYISPKSAPGMCLTAGEETTFGRNGTSPHQIKSLTLEPCDEGRAAYQQWYTRTLSDYNVEQGK